MRLARAPFEDRLGQRDRALEALELGAGGAQFAAAFVECGQVFPLTFDRAQFGVECGRGGAALAARTFEFDALRGERPQRTLRFGGYDARGQQFGEFAFQRELVVVAEQVPAAHFEE